MQPKTQQLQLYYADLSKDLIGLLNLPNNRDLFNNLRVVIEQFPPKNFTNDIYYKLRGMSDSLSQMLWGLDLRLYFDDLVAFTHTDHCNRNDIEFFDDFKDYIYLESFMGDYEDALNNGQRVIEDSTIRECLGRVLPFHKIQRQYFKVSYS